MFIIEKAKNRNSSNNKENLDIRKNEKDKEKLLKKYMQRIRNLKTSTVLFSSVPFSKKKQNYRKYNKNNF